LMSAAFFDSPPHRSSSREEEMKTPEGLAYSGVFIVQNLFRND